MIKKIQEYTGDYKIEATHGFYYLSNDGVSKFQSEEEHDSLLGSDNLNYNFLYKKCFELLKYDLEKQQNEHEWIKDAFGIITNYDKKNIGSGSTVNLRNIFNESFSKDGGFFYIDGKGDRESLNEVLNTSKREDDVFVVDFTPPEKSQSIKIEPQNME